MKRVALLGSTGSIGTSSLDVVAAHRGAFQIELLASKKNAELFAQQVRMWRPRYAGLCDPDACARLRQLLGVASNSPRFEDTELLCGESEINGAVAECSADIVIASVVGMAGLSGVLAAIDSGKDVALANKESLVACGELVLARARASHSRILPVDSEHSAIFQALQGTRPQDLDSIILTASGGPFLETPLTEFPSITPSQALRHPKWSMGSKITIDSASMMNKALEVIEARWLFDVEADRIEVVVHPESIIHSMVRLVDGTLLAQLSVPDMKGPIAYALSYEEGRLSRIMERLDLVKVRTLSFCDIDDAKFPGIRRARECLRGANGLPAVFNAANEVAVGAFLEGRISFPGINAVIGDALDVFAHARYGTLEEVDDLCASVTAWAHERCL